MGLSRQNTNAASPYLLANILPASPNVYISPKTCVKERDFVTTQSASGMKRTGTYSVSSFKIAANISSVVPKGPERLRP